MPPLEKNFQRQGGYYISIGAAVKGFGRRWRPRERPQKARPPLTAYACLPCPREHTGKNKKSKQIDSVKTCIMIHCPYGYTRLFVGITEKFLLLSLDLCRYGGIIIDNKRAVQSHLYRPSNSDNGGVEILMNYYNTCECPTLNRPCRDIENDVIKYGVNPIMILPYAETLNYNMTLAGIGYGSYHTSTRLYPLLVEILKRFDGAPESEKWWIPARTRRYYDCTLAHEVATLFHYLGFHWGGRSREPKYTDAELYSAGLLAYDLDVEKYRPAIQLMA